MHRPELSNSPSKSRNNTLQYHITRLDLAKANQHDVYDPNPWKSKLHDFAVCRLSHLRWHVGCLTSARHHEAHWDP